MSNAPSNVEECPHDRLGYEECEQCGEDNIAEYIARRVAEVPDISAAEVLAEIRAGKVNEISPEQHEANLEAWVDSLSPEFRVTFRASALR